MFDLHRLSELDNGLREMEVCMMVSHRAVEEAQLARMESKGLCNLSEHLLEMSKTARAERHIG